MSTKPFSWTETEEKSFATKPKPRMVELHGPIALMRLAGRGADGKPNRRDGPFWFNARYFWSVIDFLTEHHSEPAIVNRYLRLIMREGMAVCYDWNSFGRIYQLKVPKGQSIFAYLGKAECQPFYSPRDPHHRTAPREKDLMGGEFQYLLRVDDTVEKWITGPLPMGISGRGRA